MDPTNTFQACLINNCSAQQSDQEYSSDLMTCLESYDECYYFVSDLTNSCNVNNCIVDCFDFFPQDTKDCYSQCIIQQQSYIQQSCQSQNTEMNFLDSNYTDNSNSNDSKNSGKENNNNTTDSVNQANFMNPSQSDSENSNKALWIAIYSLIGTVILLIFLFIVYFIIKKRRNNCKTNSKSTDLQYNNNNQQQQQQQIVPPIQSVVIGVPIQENSFQIQKLPNNQTNYEENKILDQNQHAPESTTRKQIDDQANNANQYVNDKCILNFDDDEEDE
ncbi:hypothetical protein ABPG72_002456 [Tetrahymena utriculariae]